MAAASASRRSKTSVNAQVSINPMSATLAAKEAIQIITGVTPEAVSRCERDGESWVLDVEIVETKAQIADNDILATYLVELDGAGEVQRYQRTNRYARI